MGRGDGYGDDKEEEHGHQHGAEHPHEHGKVHISSEEALEKAEKKYPGERQIFHHHIHTLFSQLDGVASPRDYIKRAKEFGMTGISCTDHGNLAAIPDMYFEAADAGLRFIPGIEAYFNEYHPVWADLESKGVKLADVKADSPEIAERITRNRHLIILAKNKVGWRNMLHLTSDSWEKGFYYKPRIWMDVLRPKKEGLIVLSGCLNGPIAHELALAVKHKADHGKAQRYLENAISWVKKLKDEFAEDFFFELQMPGPDIKEGHDVLSLSIQLAKQFNIKTALTGDCHYLKKEDWETQRVLMAVGQKMTIDDPNLFMADTCEGYLKSRAEFRQTFSEFGYDRYATINDIETAMDGTIEIAERCEPFSPDLSPKLPSIQEADHKLMARCASELVKRGLNRSEKRYLVDGVMVTHAEQVMIELERIREKGFSSYFLITQDICNFSRINGWPVAPGRGSAPGSLVCYLLGITELDPLKWGLSFNRFLSPSRGGYMLKCVME